MSQLAGRLAHDLNNLLAVLVTSAQLADESLRDLADGGDRDAAVAALTADLGYVRTAAGRIETLSRQLQRLAARADGPPVPFDGGVVVTRAAAAVAGELGRDLEVHVDAERGATAVGHPALIEQAIVDLLRNANDAMPDGGLTTITVRRVDDEVRIAVADQGTGMTDAVLARAFEPLFSTRPPDRGTGLGLTAVRQVVASCGGSVEIATEPGVGTEVVVRLPGASADHVASEAAEGGSSRS